MKATIYTKNTLSHAHKCYTTVSLNYGIMLLNAMNVDTVVCCVYWNNKKRKEKEEEEKEKKLMSMYWLLPIESSLKNTMTE